MFDSYGDAVAHLNETVLSALGPMHFSGSLCQIMMEETALDQIFIHGI